MERKSRKIKENKKNTSYISCFVNFFNKELKKKTIIFACIFIIFSLVILFPLMKLVIQQECINFCMDENITYKLIAKDKVLITLITVVAGVVPYVYIPVISGIGYMYQITVEFSHIIAQNGYFIGTIELLIPYILNVISISIVTSLGIYLCKINTYKYILVQQRNMNWNTFKIELYKITGKKEKKALVEKKIKEKEEKMASKDKKIDYKQVLNTSLLCLILQLISSLIEYIVI